MDWWWDLLEAMDAHEGQAAWAQFVGAMVALCLALQQGAAAAARERAADHSASLAVLKVLRMSWFTVDLITTDMIDVTRRKGRDVEVNAARAHEASVRVVEVSRALLSLDPMTLRNPRLAAAVVDAQDAMIEFLADLSRFANAELSFVPTAWEPEHFLKEAFAEAVAAVAEKAPLHRFALSLGRLVRGGRRGRKEPGE